MNRGLAFDLYFHRYLCTVLTIIVAAALIHFSRNFGQILLSKMRLSIEVRLLFEALIIVFTVYIRN